MSRHYYPVSTHRPAAGTPARALETAKVGAVVGLCGAGAANLRRVQRAAITPEEAVAATLKAGLAAGLASGAAGLVASQFRSPLLSFLATLATGTTVMYVLTRDPQETNDER
jgi:ribose/xylose/arabinose/galactoside ABC-type transport system permease subunit